MDRDQTSHPRIRTHAVRLHTLSQVEKLIAHPRSLIRVHAGRKPIMLVLSWRCHISYKGKCADVIQFIDVICIVVYKTDRQMFVKAV
jgi:hypothetical protein